MRDFGNALYCEYLKIRRSRVFALTVAALSLAPLFGALFIVVLRSPDLAAGNEALRAKAAFTGFAPNWPSFLNLLAQAVGVGGVIVFGFVISWIFGREYSDHTIKELLTLPVRRSAVVLAKLTAAWVWSAVVVLIITLLGLLIGFALRLDQWGALAFGLALRRICMTTLLVLPLLSPVAFIATIGRGYLAPLGFVILMVVCAQIMGALGLGSYFPWAYPALYSGIGVRGGWSLNGASIAILFLTFLVGLLATLIYWQYADETD